MIKRFILYLMQVAGIRAFLVCIIILSMGVANAHRHTNNTMNSMANAFDAVMQSLSGDTRSDNSSRRQSVREISATNELDSFLQSMLEDFDRQPNTNFYRDKQASCVQRKPVTSQAPMEHAHKKQIAHVGSRESVNETLNTAIDMVDSGASAGDYDFELALNRFKQNREYGQLSLQHVIDLLDVELNLVRHLTVGHTGAIVQSALDARNAALKRSIPIAIQMYDTILSLSTYDNQNNAVLYRRTMNGKRLLKALNSYDQRIFLARIENKLEYYQDFMRSLQNSTVPDAQVANADYTDEVRQDILVRFLSELS